MDFETIWSRILAHQNENFYTTGKTPMLLVYHIVGNKLCHNRTAACIYKSQIEKAWNLHPQSTADLQKKVRGPSYIYAILSDSRIKDGI